MNRSRTSITRVAETCATPLPQVMSPESLRQFLEVLWKTSINYTMYREIFENKAPNIEEVKEFGQIEAQSLLDHEMSPVIEAERLLDSEMAEMSPVIEAERLLDHEIVEMSPVEKMSYLQSQMHFDQSMESNADSDLEDGEVRKLLTSPLYAQ